MHHFDAPLRLSINPRTAKTQFFIDNLTYIEVSNLLNFGEPQIGSPKVFLLTSVKCERFAARRPDALGAFTHGILA